MSSSRLNKFNYNISQIKKESPIYNCFRELSKNDLYKRKYKRMKRMVKEQIWENAAVCDQIATLQEKTLLLIDERNFLWKKLQQYQPYENDGHYRSSGTGENSVNKKSSSKRRIDRTTSDSSEVSKSAKNNKKLNVPSKKKKTVQSIPLDLTGRPIFPIVLGEFTVHSLGEICDKSEYHTEELIYPVGYCSTRIYGSLKDPEKQCVYTCKVMDGGQAAARFEIVADTDLDVPLVSSSIDDCHSLLLKLINSCLGIDVLSTKGRGADFFGISHPTVHHLIQASPGVRKCKGYVWTKFEVNSNVQYNSDEIDPTLTYTALLKAITFSKAHMENIREKEEEALRGILLK